MVRSSLVDLLGASGEWRPFLPDGAAADGNQGLMCSAAGDTVVDLCNATGSPRAAGTVVPARPGEEDKGFADLLAEFLQPPAALRTDEDTPSRARITVSAPTPDQLRDAIDPTTSWLSYELRTTFVPDDQGGTLILHGAAKRLGYLIDPPKLHEYRGCKLPVLKSEDIASYQRKRFPVHVLMWRLAYSVAARPALAGA